jgi:acetylornithine deacetylase/succinyl-diaminopimelate desuccinylase-like protein
VWALNTLKNSSERIQIPGFYDDVVPPSELELDLLRKLPDTSGDFLTRYELKGFLHGLTGGPEFRRVESHEPTCTICGLTSGYQAAGSKTVLPATASAKVDFRLVPDQDPKDILRKLRSHLDAHGFNDIEITSLGGEKPGRTDPGDPFVRMAEETAAETYGMAPSIVPMIGGSGPNHVFLEELRVPIVMIGVGYPGSQAHAPNENLVIRNFVDGIRHTARILERFGSQEEP